MTHCSGICEDIHFFGKAETKSKDGIVYWKICTVCVATFNVVLKFCPCCGQTLIPKLQHPTTTGSTKQ